MLNTPKNSNLIASSNNKNSKESKTLQSLQDDFFNSNFKFKSSDKKENEFEMDSIFMYDESSNLQNYSQTPFMPTNQILKEEKENVRF